MNKDILKKELSMKDVFIVIAVILSVIIYIFIFIYPKYDDFIAAKKELKNLEFYKNTFEERINEMPVLQETLDNLIEERDSKSRQLAYNMEDGMFLIGLSKKLQEYNVELINYTIEDTIQYDSFYAIPTNIELKGDYKNVRAIIDYMQNQKNITQILDYNITAYIEENSNEEATNESIIIDPVVYWIDDSEDNLYHKIDCDVLKDEIINSDGKISHGSYIDSNKENPCEVCKPYTINEEAIQIDISIPISTGDVLATFKFIMYSSNNPTLDLNNDESSTWEPGKFNPFTTTTTLMNGE